MFRCHTCVSFSTNDLIQHKYGEGCGKCKLLGEIVFCDKHNCMLHDKRVAMQSKGGSENETHI